MKMLISLSSLLLVFSVLERSRGQRFPANSSVNLTADPESWKMIPGEDSDTPLVLNCKYTGTREVLSIAIFHMTRPRTMVARARNSDGELDISKADDVTIADGSLEGDDENAYLNVVFENPGLDQDGTYACVVRTSRVVGQWPIVGYVTVEVSQVGLEEMLGGFQVLQEEIAELRAELFRPTCMVNKQVNVQTGSDKQVYAQTTLYGQHTATLNAANETEWTNRKSQTKATILDWFPGQPDSATDVKGCVGISLDTDTDSDPKMWNVPCNYVSDSNKYWAHSFLCEVPNRLNIYALNACFRKPPAQETNPLWR
ncbi:uncharacterized protein LOC106011501 [Aplysia californica]|uniref:Uncharacterized protein LOC106011501 n=1 Tax=Aplysia californica TaxID=6500 RepID=A0ABM0ZY53_APLCA|nr:uncharacterized protein LOC106011501 [Aplysia californica]